ncbi:hypothetical protein [Ruegeria sp. HU-ET01832]|uniref:hypothetical protein n=1 Tax=Ruegeria sp. HU-ET01832 TaxID=3135906 RepID=UPI0033406602
MWVTGGFTTEYKTTSPTTHAITTKNPRPTQLRILGIIGVFLLEALRFLLLDLRAAFFAMLLLYDAEDGYGTG